MADNPPLPSRGDRPSANALPLVVSLVVGVVIGVGTSWGLLFGRLDPLAPAVDFGLHVLLPALGIAVAALGLVLPLAWWGLRRFAERAQGSLEHVVQAVAAATRAASDRDAAAATSHAERAALEALAWYGPIAARGWIVRTSLAVLFAFGGLIGTALLFRQTLLLGQQNEKIDQQIALLWEQNDKINRQTELLSEQNRKLDLQTVTAEAQRRSGAAAELFSILQSLAELDRYPYSEPITVKAGLRSRIIALSRFATPYWTIDVERLPGSGVTAIPIQADRARSPERGQLFSGLVSAAVEIRPLVGATFAYADLRNSLLAHAAASEAILDSADLRGGDLTRGRFREAKLAGANLSSTLLTRTDFLLADLKYVDLRKARFFYTVFANADLRGSRMDVSSADELYFVDFTDAIIGDATSQQSLTQSPEGWKAIPEGWEPYLAEPFVRLRRKVGVSK